jgi:hypothetical protein
VRYPVDAIAVLESTSTRLVLKSGSTVLTFDRSTGKVTLQRKVLVWQRKPIEASIDDVTDVSVDAAVDRASGVEVCHTMVVLRSGQAWALPATGKQDAEANALAVRQFLGPSS